MLDLEYAEDSKAEVDMNIVRTGSGQFIEVQGTAESRPFSQDQMNEMIAMASAGVEELIEHQRQILGNLR
jgi:ribonuclease PH